MLTVREILGLSVFAPAQLVAGKSGLDNEINWVHIVDIPDAHYEWARDGVLLLTAGYGLRGDLQRQAALVPQLVEKGFAGMVLSTGYYFEHAPAEMRARDAWDPRATAPATRPSCWRCPKETRRRRPCVVLTPALSYRYPLAPVPSCLWSALPSAGCWHARWPDWRTIHTTNRLNYVHSEQMRKKE